MPTSQLEKGWVTRVIAYLITRIEFTHLICYVIHNLSSSVSTLTFLTYPAVEDDLPWYKRSFLLVKDLFRSYSHPLEPSTRVWCLCQRCPFRYKCFRNNPQNSGQQKKNLKTAISQPKDSGRGHESSVSGCVC